MRHPLVEQAHAALTTLLEAPQAADTARDAIMEIEAITARPLSVGIGGELPARTRWFDALCGGGVLDPYGRALGCAALRIERGATTGFSASRDDDSIDELARPDARAEIAASQSRADAARTDLATREQALVVFDQALPARPRTWQLWKWPIYWIARWLARGKLADRMRVTSVVDQARARLAGFHEEATAIAADARVAHNRYLESLRAACGGGPAAAGVFEVTITLAAGPLPDGIVVLELAGASQASAVVDAVLVVENDQLIVPVRAGAPVAVGDLTSAAAALPAFLADARAIRIARTSHGKIMEAIGDIETTMERREAAFRARIDRLHALRVTDHADFATSQLARVKAEITGSVIAIMEHASVHLGSELALLQQEWILAIANAGDPDALKAAVAKIEEQWDLAPRRIAEEVRVLVMGGLGGSARDIYPDLVAPLVAHGLPQEHAVPLRRAPELPPITLLPSLSQTTKLEKSGWLAGLFRSFEARRTDVREKVHARLEHMREVAEAELRDAEPRLHASIGGALSALLATAFEHQARGIERLLASERDAIAGEREALAPLVRVCDDVRGQAARLTERIAQLEREHPAVAAAIRQS